MIFLGIGNTYVVFGSLDEFFSKLGLESWVLSVNRRLFGEKGFVFDNSLFLVHELFESVLEREGVRVVEELDCLVFFFFHLNYGGLVQRKMGTFLVVKIFFGEFEV